VIADSPGSLKLQVKREAWYQISGQQLFAAGLPSADPRNLQLFVDGKQQPITLIGQDDGRLDSTDSLEFYGTGIDSPFTELNLLPGSRQTTWAAYSDARSLRSSHVWRKLRVFSRASRPLDLFRRASKRGS